MFIRRLGLKLESSMCSSGHSCPEILELEGGDFAVIGTDITEQATGNLPQGSGCGSHERVVRIPRKVLVGARSEIPVSL